MSSSSRCLMIQPIRFRSKMQRNILKENYAKLIWVFEKSLQYVKRFSRYKNPDAVRQAREILSRYPLAEFELCVLGNLCPETVEEGIAMVPSIKNRGRALDEEAIEKMLTDLSLIKKFE